MRNSSSIIFFDTWFLDLPIEHRLFLNLCLAEKIVGTKKY